MTAITNHIPNAVEFDGTMQQQTAIDKMMQEDQDRIAKELRDSTKLTMLTSSKFGMFSKFDNRETDEIGTLFEADRRSISAKKRILNNNLPEVKRINTLVVNLYRKWRLVTYPYPERGKRLMDNCRITSFVETVMGYKKAIREAEALLDDAMEDVLYDAKERLGTLFNPADYPKSFAGCWGVNIEFPAVEPDRDLAKINPKLYEREVQRIQARFDRAVEQAEEELTSNFADVVRNLAKRMEPGPDGTVKRFRGACIDNVRKFIEQFKTMNLGSNKELDRLVEEAGKVIDGKTADGLRTDALARREIADSMASIDKHLTSMLDTVRVQREIVFDD